MPLRVGACGEERRVPSSELYQRSVDEGAFRALCGGNQQEEEGESCVLIAPIAGTDGFALRDSKNPDAGTLRFHGEELRAAGMTIA
jgi:hypothetical protein